ncbi:MAG: hypothetical protein IKI24_06150 [Clostridia bacterium]|nr:hypothetical protein [Clostridia bacterium]
MKDSLPSGSKKAFPALFALGKSADFQQKAFLNCFRRLTNAGNNIFD